MDARVIALQRFSFWHHSTRVWNGRSDVDPMTNDDQSEPGNGSGWTSATDPTICPFAARRA